MNVRTLLAALAAALAVAAPAHAEEACKMTQLPNPALSLADMHKQAEARAKAWKPDAKFVSMSNTTLGLLKPDGTAASWHVIFPSEAAKSWVSIDTANGYLHVLGQSWQRRAHGRRQARLPARRRGAVRDREAARRGAARAGLRA